jgi:hypothetical protein
VYIGYGNGSLAALDEDGKKNLLDVLDVGKSLSRQSA